MDQDRGRKPEAQQAASLGSEHLCEGMWRAPPGAPAVSCTGRREKGKPGWAAGPSKDGSIASAGVPPRLSSVGSPSPPLPASLPSHPAPGSQKLLPVKLTESSRPSGEGASEELAGATFWGTKGKRR